MRIYTSYFAQLRNIPRNVCPVSIAIATPKWFTGFRCRELAPSYEDVRDYKAGIISWDEFASRYRSKVTVIYPASSILQRLQFISKGQDVVLLCYEKAQDPCHRHLLAQHLQEDGGIEVPEISFINGVADLS